MTSGGTDFPENQLTKDKKHPIEGLTSPGLISNSKFMARLSDWMGGHGGIGGAWPDCPLGSATGLEYAVDLELSACSRLALQ